MKLLKRFIPEYMKNLSIIHYFRYWLMFLFTYRQKLKRQLRGQILHNQENKKKILVPLFETSHYQHLQILIVAKALQLRGSDVKILICDEFLSGCEIKSIRNENLSNRCWKCKFHQKNILPLFQFEIVKLSSLFDKSEINAVKKTATKQLNQKEIIIKEGIKLDQIVKDSIIRYFYGAVPKDSKVVDKIKLNHIETSLLSLEASKKIMESWSPDIIFTNMYVYSAWEPMFKYFKQQNVDRFTHSISPFNYNAIIVNSFELYDNANRFNKFVENRKNKRLSPDELKQLKSFVDKRKNNRTEIFTDLDYFSDKNERKIKDLLKIDKNKRNIFLFSNVYWDVGMSDSNKLYNGVVDWVLETIDIVKNVEGLQLYIKPHPAEVFDSASSLKGISQIIREKYSTLPSNIKIIDPELKINTYKLFNFIDLGLVFNGTLGLEMALSGIPVVSAGKTPYDGLSISTEPKLVEEYKSIIFGKSNTAEVSKQNLDLFAYFYFIKTLIPFNLTDKAYAQNFKGYNIKNLNDLKPGKNKLLDHLCSSILDPKNTVIESW